MWQEFVRRFHPILESSTWRVARRWGQGSREEIEDILQEIYLKLSGDDCLLSSCRETRDDAIFSFFKVVATNTALDYFRARAAQKRGASLTTSLLDDHGSVAVSPEADLERRLTIAEIEQIMLAETHGENEDRDRCIFRFYYTFGLTAKAISSLPEIGLTPKGVEGVVQRLSASIRRRLNPTQENDANCRHKKVGRSEF